MYYVYVIQSEKKDIYIGYTTDLDNRLKAHNEGINKSTKNRKWEIVYYEAYKSKEDAIKREKRIKQSGQGRRMIKERIANSLKS